MASKSVSMATDPVVETVAGFLTPGHEYLVEIERDYQTVRLRVADLHTGESARLEATMDGSGGCGTGAVQPVGFSSDVSTTIIVSVWREAPACSCAVLS